MQYPTHDHSFEFWFLDLEEGVYRFQFKNNRVVDQIYLSSDQRICDEHHNSPEPNCNPNNEYYYDYLRSNIILPSWDPNSTRFVAPIMIKVVDEKETPYPGKVWQLHKEDIHSSFQNCLNYSMKYAKTNYDRRGSLQVELNCYIDERFPSCRCNITTNHSESQEYSLQLELFDESCIEPENTTLRPDSIHFDLFCTVQGKYNGYKYGYGYNLPVILHLDFPDLTFGSKTNASLGYISTNNTSLVIVVSVVVIGVLLVTILLFIRYKSYKSVAGSSIIALKKHPNGRWIENPDFVSSVHSSSHPTLEEDMMLPEWMRAKEEMIYNMSCITKGKELGHGQFGTVFQAQIRLKNMVYVTNYRRNRFSYNNLCVMGS